MRAFRILLPLTAALAGCGTDLDPTATGVSKDIGDNTVVEGAKDFVSCNQGIECRYLWEQARAWLDENARFDVAEKDGQLAAYSPSPDEHQDEVQYRVSQEPRAGGVATLKVETFCIDDAACRKEIYEQAYQLNEYLRAHKRALAHGIVEVEEYAAPELPRESAPDDDPRLAEFTLAPGAYPAGRHAERARATLAEEGCLAQSRLTLLRRAEAGDELYEAECLSEVRALLFRCGRAGCDLLR